MTPVPGEPIALLDAGVRVKGATTVEGFWQLLRDGADLVDEAPPGRVDLRSVGPARGAFLDDVAGFDAGYFGLSPREAASIDPQHRLLLEVSTEAMLRSGITRAAADGTRTGIYLGLLASDYLHLQMRGDGADPADRHWLTGADPAFAAGRMAYLLGVHGPAVTVNTACSSSLLAVHLACQALRLHECDVALAGGASLILAPDITAFMSRVGALSGSGRSRPFSAEADGMVRSEGAIVLALKRLSDARAADDDVLAVLPGSAVNHDGRSAGLTVPSGQAQRRLYADAMTVADVHPEDVGYLEAHGTGTPLGDPIELESLNAVYGRCASPSWVGSVKANLGHLDAAAGVTGLLKAALVVRHGEVPAQLYTGELTPLAARASFGLRVPQRLEPWVGGDRPRTAAVSSFGLSGTNVHILVRQAAAITAQDGQPEKGQPDVAPTRDAADRPVLLLLSHRTAAGLAATATAYADVLNGRDDLLRPIAAAAARARDPYEERLALVADDAAGAAATLAGGTGAAGVRSGRAPEHSGSGPVFLFGGQGNEWAGMLDRPELGGAAFADAVERCGRAAAGLGEQRLASLLADSRSDDVTDPALAPGATFALQVAQAALWGSLGVRPGAVIGHSLGEAAAAHVAGVLDLEDALRIVLTRTRLMNSAGPTGRMLAVGLSADDAADAAAGTTVEVACVNSGGSCTLSGPAAEIAEVAERLGQRGVFARVLGGCHAFHSRAMLPFAEPLRAELAGLLHRHPTMPRYPSVAGVLDGGPVEEWVANMCRPVHFSAAVERALADGWTTFLELGPVPALTRSVTEVAAGAGVAVTATGTLHRRGRPEAHLLGAVGDLFVAGEDVDLDAVLPGPLAARAAPTYAWQREAHWCTPASTGTPGAPAAPAAPIAPATLRVQLLDGAGSTLADVSTLLAGAAATTSTAPSTPTPAVPAPPAVPVPVPADEGTTGPADGVDGEVGTAVRAVLGLAPGAHLDRGASLVDLGLDSVGAGDLCVRLNSRLGADLDSDLVLGTTTLDELVDAVGVGGQR